MFVSNLTSLLWMLQATGVTDILSTEGVASGVPWQARLALSEGRVTFCEVRKSADGQILLTDSEAFRWLASQGNLSWEQSEAPPHHSQPDPFHPRTIPKRRAGAEQGELHVWSRKQRQVFGLVDGSRSVERIALMLCQPLGAVEEIVHILQAKGVIAVEDVYPVKSEVREERGIL